jgi:hypothetical protein
VLTYTGSTHLFTLSQPFSSAPVAGNHFNLSRLGAGQVTGVWNDFGTNDLVNPANPPFDSIVSNSLSGGGGIQVQGATGAPGDALAGTPNIAVTTPFTATVNTNDGRFPTITALDVSVTLSDQNLNDLHLKLLSPTLTASNVQAAPSPSTTSFAGDSTLSNNSIAPTTSSVQTGTASTVQAMPAPTTASFAGGASLSSIDGFYKGAVLTFTSGPNAGQSRTVTTYTGSTKVFTFAMPWGTVPVAGNAFIVPGITTNSFAGDPSLSSIDGFYDAYALTFTSGANAGLTRTVLSYLGNTRSFTLSAPLPSAPAAGSDSPSSDL